MTLEQLKAAWIAFLTSIGYFPPVPPPPIPDPPPVPKPPHISKIPVWALAIQHEEGGKPWDLNMVNHNPGNLKYSSYTASLGGKKAGAGSDGGHFCYFETYDKGFKALCQFLTDAANNLLIPFHHARTLDEFTTVYARPPKNHPYAKNVAKALDVPVTIPIKELL